MSAADKPRVVLDSGVYLQALISLGGPAAALLGLLDTGEISLFVSDETLSEIQDVLSRPRIRQRHRTLTDERVAALFQRLSDKGGEMSRG